VVGLLLGIRHLAIHGATADQMRPTRRLLIFSSLVALALNVADPIIAGQFGKAAFDAVGPLLLIGWAEVGPGLLGALAATNCTSARTRPENLSRSCALNINQPGTSSRTQRESQPHADQHQPVLQQSPVVAHVFDIGARQPAG
jgi:hypothetical protein